MTNNSSEQILQQILELIPNTPPADPVEFRAYYDPTNGQIICFSQEKLDKPYCLIKEQWYNTFRPDLFYVENNQVYQKDIANINKIRLKKGSTYATLKGDMQFAVDKHSKFDKDYWDQRE